MKTGVIYARYSSNVQTEQSIEGQVHVITEYAERNGIEIVGSYIDKATTGTNDNRPGFQSMMKDSFKKEWDCILVYKLDRFSRNKYEMAIHRKTLRNNGIRLISVTENIPDSPEGVILESVLEGMAEYYSLDISQKTKRGKRESRLKGNYDGGAIAYGYKIVKVNGEYKAAICDKNAAVVRRIFEEYLSGKVVQKIVDGLNADGIRNQRGNPFSVCTVTNMLHNERYIGRCKYRDDKVYTNIFPRLIPDDWFELAQRFLKENHRGANSAKNPFILKSKLKCGCCGGKMRGNSATTTAGKTFRYYSCVNKLKNKKLCTKTSIHKEILEKTVIDTVMKILYSSDGIDTIVDRIYEINESKRQNNDIIKALLEEKKKCQRQLDNIMEAVEKGIFTDSVKERIASYEAQLAALNNKISEKGSEARKSLSKDDIRKKLNEVIRKEPAQIIRLLIKQIVVYEDKVEIYFYHTDKNGPDEDSHQAICFYSERIKLENTEGAKMLSEWEVFVLV